MLLKPHDLRWILLVTIPAYDRWTDRNAMAIDHCSIS